MTKPRVFIGSSVEGLNIAYAVQQNLLHEAEVTVWDQGVFELSRTTMESLTKALVENDFAVFVFSPDDLVRMRDHTSPAVRDNVLFEFGLFIGRLGRDRVFFLLPEGCDLHLPTDLLGVTPGKYESARSDGSMQSATAPACHQMRNQMKALGLAPGRIPSQTSADDNSGAKPEKRFWFQDFIEEKYGAAKEALETELKGQSGEDALVTMAWIHCCDLKQRNDGDISPLTSLAAENPDAARALVAVTSILRMEHHADEAIRILSSALVRRPKDAAIAKALAYCHSAESDNASAISELQKFGSDDFPDLAIDLAAALERENQKEEALRVVQRCHIKHPGNREIRFKYAQLAHDLGLNAIAAHLLHDLCNVDPNRLDYWGSLGNSCLQLNLHDRSLIAYRRAEKLTKNEQHTQWIIANIGNLFNNIGVPTEACEYLERALKYDPKSEYSHDRLASALKKKAAEEKAFQEKCAEGKRQIREAAAKLLSPSAAEPTL
ncbi:MAG TPA: TIR domain-containing protein [Spongiibacteraceae bacterium]|nr:TIR domain-containing protein [Spongiibacteraceae bacterium]